ncbi:unnamed protein product [Leuciscus chuanchicus]
MYLIVEFVGEGTTGTIAKSWYSDGHSWWPPFRDLDRLLKSVRMMEAPQPDKGWTKHQVRILHESGPVVRPLLTPSRAGKSFSNSPVVPVSLSQADEPWHEHPPAIQENTFSILRPNQQQGQQGRMQNEPWHEHPPAIQVPAITISCIFITAIYRITEYRHMSSTHQARTQNINNQPVNLNNGDNNKACCRTGFTDEMRITISRFKSPSASGVRRWSRISDQCTPVERMILETLQELDMKVNHLTSVVQSLAGRSNVPVLVVDSEDDVFPLTSMEDLDNLERQLSERGMMQKMPNI